RGHGYGVRTAVLGFRPVDDPFLAVPLVDVQTCDFLDALSSEHQDPNGARVRWVDGSIRAFEPAIKPNKFVFVEPACALALRLSRNSGCGVSVEFETPRRCASVIKLGFYCP